MKPGKYKTVGGWQADILSIHDNKTAIGILYVGYEAFHMKWTLGIERWIVLRMPGYGLSIVPKQKVTAKPDEADDKILIEALNEQEYIRI